MEESPASEPTSGSAPESTFDRRLREAGSEELLDLVRAHLAELEPPSVRQVLRNPYCTREIVELLADQPRLVSFYEVRRDLALHPRAPEPLALRFVPGLWWRDLMALGLDTRLRPRLRRAADQALIIRLPEIALGEKINLARRAGTGVLSQLRNDPNPRVISALLDNPRLTEDILAPVVHAAGTPSEYTAGGGVASAAAPAQAGAPDRGARRSCAGGSAPAGASLARRTTRRMRGNRPIDPRVDQGIKLWAACRKTYRDDRELPPKGRMRRPRL